MKFGEIPLKKLLNPVSPWYDSGSKRQEQEASRGSMVFQKFDHIQNEGQRSVRIEYASTWRYDTSFVLAAAQAILDSDMRNPEDVRRITADGSEITFLTREAGLSLSAVPKAQGCRALTLSGISRIMEVPVTFSFQAGTDRVVLESGSLRYFARYGGHVFDRYMDSIEITACCAIAVARAQKDPARQEF